jgi:hypothetical protein
MVSPVQGAKGFMTSLTAIGELSSRDGTPLEQQQQDMAAPDVGVGAGSG